MASRSKWLKWFSDPIKWCFLALLALTIGFGLNFFQGSTLLLAASPYLAPIVFIATIAAGLALLTYSVFWIVTKIKEDKANAADLIKKQLSTDLAVDSPITISQQLHDYWILKHPSRSVAVILGVLSMVVMTSFAIWWIVEPASMNIAAHGLKMFFDFLGNTLSDLFAQSHLFELAVNSVGNAIAVTMIAGLSGIIALVSLERFGNWIYKNTIGETHQSPVQGHLEEKEVKNIKMPCNSTIKPTAGNQQYISSGSICSKPLFIGEPVKLAAELTNFTYEQRLKAESTGVGKQAIDDALQSVNEGTTVVRFLPSLDHELKMLCNPADPSLEKSPPTRVSSDGKSHELIDKTQKLIWIGQDAEGNKKFDWRKETPKIKTVHSERTDTPLLSTSLVSGKNAKIGAGRFKSFEGFEHNKDTAPVGIGFDETQCRNARYSTCDRRSDMRPHRKTVTGDTAKSGMKDYVKEYTKNYVPSRDELEKDINAVEVKAISYALSQNEVFLHTNLLAFRFLAFKTPSDFKSGPKEYWQGGDPALTALGELTLKARMIAEKIRFERAIQQVKGNEQQMIYIPMIVLNRNPYPDSLQNKDAAYRLEDQRADMLKFLNHYEYPQQLMMIDYRPKRVGKKEGSDPTTLAKDIPLEDIMEYFGIQKHELTHTSPNLAKLHSPQSVQ